MILVTSAMMGDKKQAILMQQILNYAEELRRLRKLQHEKVMKMQKLATTARITGRPQDEELGKLDRQFTVIDYGNAIDGICDTLDKFERRLTQ